MDTRAITPKQLKGDFALAGALLVLAILSATLGLAVGFYRDSTAPMWQGLIYCAALTVPLAWRRKAPSVVTILVGIAFMSGALLKVPDMYVGSVAFFIAMYSLGAWSTNRRRAFLVRASVIAGMFIWMFISLFYQGANDEGGWGDVGLFSPFAAYALLTMLVNIAFFGGAYYMGDRAYLAALQKDELQERTRQLAQEQELSTAQAIVLERMHIARELHDVVAHHVSAMGVQAGAARSVLTNNADAAATALATVEESARTSLSELRQLLETLRTADDNERVGEVVTLDSLPDLVALSTASGVPTTLHIIGNPKTVSQLVHTNLYRIAQEALTNVRRHASGIVQAELRLRYEEFSVELEVTNTGHLIQRPVSGLGLLGMRERAHAIGGVLEAQPLRDGGFLVRTRASIQQHDSSESLLLEREGDL